MEATIPQLQTMMAAKQLTSRELTLWYLQRIRQLNPLLGAVIETNPNAVGIAARRDAERMMGINRGPLHGIPVLVKDNIATDDNMQTTAGSLALVNSRVPADATVVSRLRAAGAVILGKANLSEWANFRGFAPFNGWTARGGFTRNPYLLDFDPCGSSSGSAVAPAANLCAAAVGTETSGSILCPSGNNLIVGIKPTVGLVSQSGIIPITATQDTAGPMCRTVTDAAIMLGAMQSPFGAVAGQNIPSSYTPFLQPGALAGKRIGVDKRYFTFDYGGEADIIEVVNQGLTAMQNLGATIVETDTGDIFGWFDYVIEVLHTEFKATIKQYLAGLSHTSMRSLSDLIAFNIANCRDEMKYFGQELFEISEATSGDLSDPAYVTARTLAYQFAGALGIDKAMSDDNLDAIVAPSYSFASVVAAAAGYPSMSLPLGLSSLGRPSGIWMYAGFLQESKLISFAYDLEQYLPPRIVPQYIGQVPPEPPDAGICDALPFARKAYKGKMRFDPGTGKPFRR